MMAPVYSLVASCGNVSDMNEHVYAGRCLAPGCKATGEIAADSYTLGKLGVAGGRGKLCQGCLRGTKVGKGQLLSKLQTGGGDARRLQLGGEARKLQAGGEVGQVRTELDEAPELLTVGDSDDEEGEDVVEVYGGDCQVEEVVRKVATKMSLQLKMGQEERNIGVRVERLQGQVEVTQGLFRDLEREVEEIQQLLYAEVLFPMCYNLQIFQLIRPG